MQDFSQQLYQQSIHCKKNNIEKYSIYDAIIEAVKLSADEYYIQSISRRAIVFYNKMDYRKTIIFQYLNQSFFITMIIEKYSDNEYSLFENNESIINEIKNFEFLFVSDNKHGNKDFSLSMTNNDTNGLTALKEIDTIKTTPFFLEKSIKDAHLSHKIKYTNTTLFKPEYLDHKFYLEYILVSAHIKHRFNINIDPEDFNLLFSEGDLNDLFVNSSLNFKPKFIDYIQFDENNRFTKETKHKFGENDE